MRHRLERSLYDEAPCGALIMKPLLQPHLANCDSCHEVISWNRYHQAVMGRRLSDVRAEAQLEPTIKPDDGFAPRLIIPTARKKQR